jgi:uncharacterized membrane protein YgdD (TMEM256/DUF423 family)
MNSSARLIVLAAGLLGFTGVALGAFGAHALKETLVARGTVTTWQTAVLYHLVHAVALLALAGWAHSTGSGLAGGWPNARWIGVSWSLGVILFSGSLYWLSLGGPKFLGPVTPLGGLAFLAGWLLVAWNALSSPKA